MKNNNITNWINSNPWLLWGLLLAILIIDKIVVLTNFGFIYTDIDQTIIWNGAIDYSRGIFHEPYFYRQSYNYMIEALLAVPLIWIGTPVYIALPISTTIISIFPFLFISLFLRKRKFYFWSNLFLIMPVILPLEFNMITMISRGFVQAHLFIPFLIIPLLNPKSNKHISLLFIFSSLSFIMNQSSIIIIFPILVYIFLFHYKSRSFYLKSFLVIPILFIDFLAKYFYQLYPEYKLHGISGLYFNKYTFYDSFTNINLFEFLFPFSSKLGILYAVIILILAFVAYKKAKKKEFVFIISFIVLLIATFSFPKIHWNYGNGGLFYSPSRFYLLIPVIVLITCFMLFKKTKMNWKYTLLILFISSLNCFYKTYEVKKQVQEITAQTAFPISKIDTLIANSEELYQISKNDNPSIIIINNKVWDYTFKGYSFYPLVQNKTKNNKKSMAINLIEDRRTWLYSNTEIHERVLLHGFDPSDSTINTFDHKIVNEDNLIISNNTFTTKELTTMLNSN